MIGVLPSDRRERSTWRYVVARLNATAARIVEQIKVSIAQRLVLMMDGVICSPD